MSSVQFLFGALTVKIAISKLHYFCSYPSFFTASSHLFVTSLFLLHNDKIERIVTPASRYYFEFPVKVAFKIVFEGITLHEL